MKPIIGIIGKFKRLKKHNIIYSYHEIIEKIIAHGGIPIQINLLENNIEDTIKIINKIDGFILQGGREYTKEEENLIKLIYTINKPLLGICLGMQTIGITFNGNLKKVKKHHLKNNKTHEVKILKETKAYEIFKKNKIIVNSRHHFKLLTSSLDISGISNDNTIEIIEDKEKKFFIGIQWHPESLNNDDTNNLFNYFIKEAGDKY